jgi:hypothetical protein
MEVRAGQRSSTIAQAMAHNTSTIERDLDMFRRVMEARGERETALAQLDAAQADLRSAYERFLAMFAREIADDVANGQHEPDAVIGAERVHTHPVDADAVARMSLPQDNQPTTAVVLAARRAAVHRAERYETR